MRKDILGVMDVFREKGYVCGYLTTNGTIITDERADGAGRAGERRASSSTSASRSTARASCTTRRAASKGTFERTAAGLRRLQAAAAQRHAPLRVSINTTVAHETLDALDRDGRRRRGARRRRDRPQSPDVQHAGRSRRDRAAHRRARTPSAISTFVTADPGPRCRARAARRWTRSIAQVPRARHPLRHAARRSGRPSSSRYYTPGARARGPLPVSVPLRARLVQRQGVLLPVHPGRSRRPDDAVARRGLDGRALRRRCGGSSSKKASFPVCRRCCKVELAAEPRDAALPDAAQEVARCRPRWTDISMLGAPHAVRQSAARSAASPSRARAAARSARKCSARPSRRTRSRSAAALLPRPRLRRPARRPHGDAAVGRRPDRAARRAKASSPTLIVFPSTTPTLDADVVGDGASSRRATARRCSASARTRRARREASMERAPAVDGMFVGEPEDGLLALGALDSLDRLDDDSEPDVPPRRRDRAASRARQRSPDSSTRRIPAWDLLDLDAVPAAARQRVATSSSRRRAAARTRATSASRRFIRATSSARRAPRRSSTRSSAAIASSA